MNDNEYKERIVEASKSLDNVLAAMMVTYDQVVEAFFQINKYLPPLGDEDIERIRQNPTLSWISKIILINQIKRDMEKERKYEERSNH